MPKDAFRPYEPQDDGAFGTDREAEDSIRIGLRRIDGQWRILATEPGHAEHLHSTAFQYFDDARQLRDEIRGGLAAGLQLNLNHWETRAL